MCVCGGGRQWIASRVVSRCLAWVEMALDEIGNLGKLCGHLIFIFHINNYTYMMLYLCIAGNIQTY